MIGRIKVEFCQRPQLDGLLSDAMTNWERVNHLVEVYRALRAKHKKPKGRVWTQLSDILRAAVILCHANLEEGLRRLIYIEADWDRDFLNRISLPGQSRIHGGERFYLGDLLTFKDLKVSEVIKESISEHLKARSFNRIEDVADAIKLIGLPTKPFKRYFPQLNQMITRRHSIAHTADREDEKGRGHQTTKSISEKTVVRWNDTVQIFIHEVAVELSRTSPNKSRPAAKAQNLRSK